MRNSRRSLLTLILLSLAGSSPSPAQPMPARGPAPEVLLAAPLDAAFAATHAPQFRELGFRGFLFQGIVPGLGVTEPWADLAASTETLRTAQTPLAEAGLDRNFLVVALAPDRRYHADLELLDSVRERFAAAGRLCQETGLRGLAVDTRQDGLFQDFRWDGYDHFDTPPPRLLANAQDFLASGIRAFLRECPEAELLLLAEDPLQAGPLWWAGLAGAVEALGAAVDLRLHLLPRAAATAATYEELLDYRQRLERLLEQRLPPELLEAWQRQCTLGPVLQPLRSGGAGLYQHVALETFRVQLAAAKVIAPAYVGVEVPATAGTAGAGLAPEALLGHWSVRTPLDHLVRIGPGYLQGTASVLQSATEAAVLAWQGLTVPLEFRGRHESLLVTPLTTGARQELFPRDGAVRIEATPEPILVERLPLAEYALPAAAQAWVEPPEHGALRAGIHLRLQNVTPLRLESPVQFWPPAGYGIGSDLAPVRLAPGREMQIDRWLQGSFAAGQPLRVQITLNLPGQPLHLPALEIRPQPQLNWRHWRDGPGLGMRALPHDPGSPALLAVASARGDVAMYAADGQARWDVRLPVQLAAGPVAGVGRRAETCIGVASSRGEVHLISGAGALTVTRQPSRTAVSAMAFAEGFDPPYGAVATGTPEGRVHCHAADGSLLWETDVSGTDVVTDGEMVLASGGAEQPRLFGAFAGDAVRVFSLDTAGEVVWNLPVENSGGAPLLGVLDDALVAGLGAEIQVWDAATGAVLASTQLDRGEPVQLIAVLAFGTGAQVAASDGHYLYGMSPQLWPLWRTRVPARPSALHALETAHGALLAVGLATGALQFYSPAGVLVCEDTRALGPITSLGHLGRPASQVLSLATDGAVRAYDLGFLAPPPLPPRDAYAPAPEAE